MTETMEPTNEPTYTNNSIKLKQCSFKAQNKVSQKSFDTKPQLEKQLIPLHKTTNSWTTNIEENRYPQNFLLKHNNRTSKQGIQTIAQKTDFGKKNNNERKPSLNNRTYGKSFSRKITGYVLTR